VLYVHGYNDYFFQVGLADWFDRRGMDFYAVDLRRYGRSLTPDGLPNDRIPNYIEDLADYDEELDTALNIIGSAGPRRVLIVAHSTGGLIAPLWAARRPDAPIEAMVLNSPFLELPQPAVARGLVSAAAATVGRPGPLRRLIGHGSLPGGVDTNYGDSLHASRRGEWDYNLAWKPSPGFPIRLGWLGAVLDGQRAVHAGLDLRLPILSMSSTRTVSARGWSDDLQRGDSVLDADAIARRGPDLGRNVTVARIEDGMHDLFLSPRPARDRAYDTMGRWLAAWVD
jgi:alpha-beta hydrolase superfamily lysophospholipase